MEKSENCSVNVTYDMCQGDEESCEQKPLANSERYPSRSSSLHSNSSDLCRICRCEETVDLPLIVPCYCRGSLRYVHRTCIQRWIEFSGKQYCNICNYQFMMQTKWKPFKEWQCIPLHKIERSILWIFPLYCIDILLIKIIKSAIHDRMEIEALQNDRLSWSIWIAWITFTGFSVVISLVIIFLIFLTVYVLFEQCQFGISFCQRWRAYNRTANVYEVSEESNTISDKNTNEVEHLFEKSDSSNRNTENMPEMPETNPIDIKTNQLQVKSQIEKAEIVIEIGENCSVEYVLDCERVAEESNELPTSRVLFGDENLLPNRQTENSLGN